MARTAIIGSGLTGLLTARQLLMKSPDHTVLMFEQAPEPGGLFQSSEQCGTWFNHGLWLFRSNSRLVKLFPEHFVCEPVKFFKLTHSEKRLFPLDPKELAMLTQGSRKFLAAMQFMAVFLRRILCPKPKNLHDWLIRYMPPPWIQQLHLDDYVFKLMGHEARALSPQLGHQRLKFVQKATSLMTLLKHLGTKRIKSAMRKVHSDLDFIKISGEGCGGLSRYLAREVEQRGAHMIWNASITQVQRNSSKVEIHLSNGSVYEADFVVSTIPIEELYSYVTHERLGPSDCLDYRDLLVMMFRLRTTIVQEGRQILYSFDRQHCWKRATIEAVAQGGSTLTIEVTGSLGQSFDFSRLKEEAICDFTDKYGFFDRDDLECATSLTVRRAYPSMLVGYEQKYRRIADKILSPQIMSVGRQGGYAYFLTNECVDQSVKTANMILENSRSNSSK